MTPISLDTSKLLGFRIVAQGQATGAAKIGGKIGGKVGTKPPPGTAVA